jgi:putative tricarboxylic transport membrane protein
MEIIQHLFEGFQIALTPINLLYCLIGVLWGTIVGVLPGIGPMGGLAILLPMTFKMDPTSGIIMLAGIFYGAMYGGSTTSILLNIPGEAASVVTCIDGYQMARKGRAGPALVVSALGSFVGGTVSIVALMLFAPPLARVMLKIGPGEEFSLMLLALIVMSFVSSAPILKTLMMIILGLLIATVGMDPFTAYPRFTFGYTGFAEGLGFISMAIGLFGISEILINFEEILKVEVLKPTLRSLFPRWKDLRDSAGAVGRGSLIGLVFGFIPGASHIISTFVSYAVEKKISKHPEEFGKGKIEGVAGPETANNAATGTALVPLLVLGIPAIPSTALLMSALLVHNINPGPQLIQNNPDVFWGLIASMYVGNCMLVFLNLPMVGVFINFLRIPYPYLAPTILVICIVGVYGVSFNTIDIAMMGIFGIIGYLLRKFKFDVSPLILAVVLGDKIEMSLRRALTISEGSLWIFFKSSFSKIFVVAALLILVLQTIAWLFGFRVRGESKSSKN